MRTYGQHADSPPPGMLTGIRLNHLMLLNDRTNDGRLFEDQGFGTRELPIGFSAMFTTNHGPGQAHLVGNIDYIVVNDDNTVDGLGWLMDAPNARDAGRLIKAKVLRGNSAELSVRKVRIDWDSEAERVKFDFQEYEVSASTAVANPAMRDCFVELEDPDFDFGTAGDLADATAEVLAEAASIVEDAGREHLTVGSGAMLGDINSFQVLTAGSAVMDPPKVDRKLAGNEPPAAWFTEESLNQGIHYPIRVTTPNEKGLLRVHGYVAAWGEPHLSVPGITLLPPRNLRDYAYFANGEVLTDDGETIPIGRLTYGGSHAGEHLNWKEATAHYDNTLSAWADVAIGENEHGIWVAGYVRPGVDANTLTMARASALSGDWRRISGNLELVGVLSVNAPAFPNPRPTAMAEGGVQTCLIGAGLIVPDANLLVEVGLPQSTLSDLRVIADDVRRREAGELAEQLGDPEREAAEALALSLELEDDEATV